MNDWEESWENHYVRYDNSEYYRSRLESEFDYYAENYSDNNYLYDDCLYNDAEDKQYDNYPNSGY